MWASAMNWFWSGPTDWNLRSFSFLQYKKFWARLSDCWFFKIESPGWHCWHTTLNWIYWATVFWFQFHDWFDSLGCGSWWGLGVMLFEAITCRIRYGPCSEIRDLTLHLSHSRTFTVIIGQILLSPAVIFTFVSKRPVWDPPPQGGEGYFSY